jgi:hypothetical protein
MGEPSHIVGWDNYYASSSMLIMASFDGASEHEYVLSLTKDIRFFYQKELAMFWS